jgi:leucyl-tRNA synthetase
MKLKKTTTKGPYDHTKIEKKWQKYWESKKIFSAKDGGKNTKKLFRPATSNTSNNSKKFYSLIEFPFASGEGLHVGHIRSNTAMDVISHKRRMQGYNVLYPIGWDSFGLPTENYAIKTGKQPALITKINTLNFKRQLKSLGFSFDWSREIDTSDPKYYKWTQWIFLQLLKHGLAYKKKLAINWCPKDLIGLANEEVVDGKCDRCGTPVEKREKEQWMLAITKYAERLHKDLDETDFLEKIKIQQRNWIGKSEGAEIEFPLVLKDGKQRFVLLHGFEGGADRNFFPWLKKMLEERGYTVECPQLPSTMNPSEAEQVEHVLKNCHFDEHTVIIGHSLGAVVAMKALMKLNKPISGLLVVAAAIDPAFHGADSRPFWKKFTWDYDFDQIKKLTGGRIAIISDTQEKMRSRYLKELSEKLGAFLIETKAAEEHFTATVEPDVLRGVTAYSKVFTTRPDTLYGVTYIVLAPENFWVQELLPRISNKAEVEKYIADVKKKTDIERTAIEKEKTGVELKGITALHPLTQKEIPVWIADYVLADYGTGAVMAVPAHDERDYAFAKKYKLQIKNVIEPLERKTTGDDAFRSDMPISERNAAVCVIKHWSEDKYLGVRWKKTGWQAFVVGGIEPGEDVKTAAIREAQEETGYQNFEFEKELGGIIHSQFYQVVKKENRFAHFHPVVLKLKDSTQLPVAEHEKELQEAVWLSPKEFDSFITHPDMRIVWERAKGNFCYSGEGLMTNSEKFDGQMSHDIMKEITEEAGGEWVTKFKLRDWVFSRQRYWGEPIPVIHCEKCGVVPLKENDLPLKLPPIKNYKPTETGESPLATISKWVNVKCPNCKGKARRETDTMPNWAGSSWYYLRYVDPKNGKAFADTKKLDYWTPVDWYNGGMEHTTLHLLYSRFWHKFLYDLKLVPSKEPYQKRTSHGLILAAGGEKMSKSKGNVVNPDAIVKTVGADALRVYEMFMGPFDQHIAWDENGIVGTRRFIEKVWRLQEKVGGKNESDVTKIEGGNSGEFSDASVHKTIKKVSEDIEAMHFNTAVSAMMILVNEMEKASSISRGQYETLIQLVAPFAPHVAEEIWQILGNKKSIFTSEWPVFNPALVIEATTKIIVQINGKTRASFESKAGITEEEAKNMALNMPEIKKWTENKEIKKMIFVKGRLLNIVV